MDLADNVVGRTSFCIHPRSTIGRVRRVGGTKTVKFDRIEQLNATHVIVNIDENRREDAEELQRRGLSVIATHPCEPLDNLCLYRLLGAIFNRERQAQALCERFSAALRALQERVEQLPRQRVLYLIWREPWMSISRTTYIARMLAAAGLDVIDCDDFGLGSAHSNERPRYPQLEIDRALLSNYDCVLLSSEPYPFKEVHRLELEALAGAGGPSVRFIDGEMTSWYGSRAIAGCEYLANLRTDSEPRSA